MKYLGAALLATFILALIIIYHDSQRRKSLDKPADTVRIIICDGKIARIKGQVP